MRIIERVEISHFRSFSKTVTLENCNDVNIISGKNDSGKSNILKALNLFFTENKVDFYDDLFFKNDFSRVREKVVTSDQVKGKKIFKIRVLFNRQKFSKSVLPEQFWIEKTWDKEGHVSRKTKEKSGKILKHQDSTTKVDASTTSFLKKVHFLYIPAIKDGRFFDHLKNEYQLSLGASSSKTSYKKDKKLTLDDWMSSLSAEDITNLLSEKINTEAVGMMKHFINNTKEIIESKFIIPDLDFSKVLDVETENDIPLSSRGDGVQTKFIPQILNEISRNNKADLVIWGFEEPENSFEYSNAQLLADKFKDEYSKNKQIYITTHSFNFISLTGDNVSRYRVWKENYEEGTQVRFFDKAQRGLLGLDDDQHELLEKELGILELNRELKEVFEKKEEERTQLLEMHKRLQERLEDIDKPILYVEDKYDQIYKISWLKINDIEFDKDSFEKKFNDKAPFIIIRAEGASNLEGFLRATNIDYWKDKKIVGLFDFDETGVEKFNTIKRRWKKELVGSIEDGHYLNRTQDGCFCSLLIPIPDRLKKLASLSFPSFVEIENLLPDSFLIEENSFAEKKITTGDTEYLKMKTDKKSKLWRKLFALDKVNFKDFKQLFDTLSDLHQ